MKGWEMSKDSTAFQPMVPVISDVNPVSLSKNVIVFSYFDEPLQCPSNNFHCFSLSFLATKELRFIGRSQIGIGLKCVV